jgi:hypothetical protein
MHGERGVRLEENEEEDDDSYPMSPDDSYHMLEARLVLHF